MDPYSAFGRKLNMKMTELFLGQLEREAATTRRVVEGGAGGRGEWGAHARAMQKGYLATLVATMPGWVDMMINRDELDLRPVGGAPYKQPEMGTAAELVAALDASVAKGRAALEGTTDDHLMTSWRFMVGGKVASEN